MEITNTIPPEPYNTNSSLWMARADDIEAIIHAEKYLPIIVRTAYYSLISSPLYSNPHWLLQSGKNKGDHICDTLKDPKLSNMVSKIVKYLRLSGRIPFDYITDESRIATLKKGHSDPKAFAKKYSSCIFPTYDGCTADQQEVYAEVWIEKNGLVHIAKVAADRFCRRTIGCKGAISVTAIEEAAARMLEAGARGQEAMILYYGDLDPSGWDLPEQAHARLHYEHDAPAVRVFRKGLLPEQVTPDMVPIELAGTKGLKKRFIAATGLTVSYELNVLPSDDLIDMIAADLEEITDMEVFKLMKKRGKKINNKFIDIEEDFLPEIRERLRQDNLL